MWSLLLVILVVSLAAGWTRSIRMHRAHWLERLSLPGTWRCDAPASTLELRGDLASGEYVETSAGGTERGEWSLHGHTLILTTARTTNEYDLRLFEEGEIGIDGPERERRIYKKQQSNVVPLRRRR